MLEKFFKKLDKKQVISWALYDFANSAYFLIIVTFIFPIYFKEVIAQGTYSDFWWGFSVSISILLGGLATPVIGAISDYDLKKKKKFMFFSILAILGTALLYFTGPNLLFFSIIIFIATNLCVEISQTLYDSFLPHVSDEKTTGRISGLGYAMGYLGGIVALLILKPLYSGGYSGELESLYKLTFPLTSLFFLLFALPSFIFIKEKKKTKIKNTLIEKIRLGFKKTFKTLKEVRKHKRIAWFLLAFYILNDALVTLFAFVSIYATTTLSMSLSEIAVIFLIIQGIGVPATIFFGWLSDKKGPKKILLLTILIWILIIINTALATTKVIFYVIAVLTGMVVGSNQAIARSWFTKIIPKNRTGEFFGFNGFANKVAAITGPLVFGIISSLTGNQRIAMAALLPYFIISFIIFYNIKEKPTSKKQKIQQGRTRQ
jgi:UMF1 family MFS transporter